MTANPMVLIYGPGPEGKTCWECSNIRSMVFNRRIYKCRLRGITASAATDHRPRWPACALMNCEAAPVKLEPRQMTM